MATPDGVVMGLDLGSRVAWAYGLPNANLVLEPSMHGSATGPCGRPATS